MMESKGPMIQFSIIVACLLLISLPLKRAYFLDSVSADDEILKRQVLATKIATYLAPRGFTVTSPPDDEFHPEVMLTNEDCVISIAPLPIITNSDNTFEFLHNGSDDSLMYYYDGEFFDEPSIIWPTFWENASRVLPRIGINPRQRIRLGVAYSVACDLQDLQLDQMYDGSSWTGSLDD